MDTKTLRRIAGIATLAATIAAAAGTGTAGAATASSCPTRTLVSPFSTFGDTNSYFFAPNGGFESGLTGWTSGGGATVVSGNESSYLHGRTDTRAVSLPTNAWVKTQAICTGPNDQSIRLMVKGTSGQLKVDAYILSGGNIRTWSTQVDAKSGSSWRPSQVIQFALGNQYLGDTTIQLTFTAIGAPWQIDDLYIDPLKAY
jgi:hypothetical protein